MLRRVAKLSVLAGLAAIALPGVANAGVLTETAKGCPEPTLGQPFTPWIDYMQYMPSPGATAETADGWNLDGDAAIAPGQEPWEIAGDGTSSLRLPAGSSAQTDTMCVGIEYPTIRFFARSSNAGLLSSLRVDVTVETWLGATVTLPIATVLPTGGRWSVTPPYLIVASLLPLLPGDLTPIRLTFTPQGSGTWQVDDVFVDPYRGR